MISSVSCPDSRNFYSHAATHVPLLAISVIWWQSIFDFSGICVNPGWLSSSSEERGDAPKPGKKQTKKITSAIQWFSSHDVSKSHSFTQVKMMKRDDDKRIQTGWSYDFQHLTDKIKNKELSLFWSLPDLILLWHKNSNLTFSYL